MRKTPTSRPETPNPKRKNPRIQRWDYVDVGIDGRTLRVGYIRGLVEGLHHVEVVEGDDEIRVSLFLGIDPDFEGGFVTAAGFEAWTIARTNAPVGQRRVGDGADVVADERRFPVSGSHGAELGPGAVPTAPTAYRPAP